MITDVIEVQGGYVEKPIIEYPVDWDAVRLQDLCLDIQSGFPCGERDDNGIIQFRMNNINQDGHINLDSILRVPIPENIDNYLLEYGDILFNNTNSIDLIGKTAIFKNECGHCTYSNHLTRIRVDSSKTLAEWLLYNLIKKWEQGYFKRICQRHVGQVGIALKDLKETLVPKPPLSEQLKIAAILSSVDAAIEQTDTTIAQTERMKKGLMQGLLTGKCRLPVFVDKWKMVAFEQVATIRRDKVNPKAVGELPFCIELEHIEQGSGRLIGCSKASEQSSIKSVFHQGDVLFGKLRAYLRKYWLADRDGVCSTEIWALMPNRRLITPGFLFQLVTTDQFIDVAGIAYGTHMPRTDWNVIKSYQVNLPYIPEQEAIVAILSSIDEKMNVEKKYHEHLVKLKKGLMQDLLTGRVRVKVDGHA